MWQRLKQTLQNFEFESSFNLKLPQQPKKSAVLVPLFVQDGNEYLFLTKRSEKVEHHKGQICFPGGSYDEEDNDLWQTALRETSEEVGIQSDSIEYIGKLSEIVTPTGFSVYPYVGLIEEPNLDELQINNDEIAETFSVPIHHLMNPENLHFIEKEYFGKTYSVPVYTYKHHEIWGATGRIISELLDVWKMAAA